MKPMGRLHIRTQYIDNEGDVQFCDSQIDKFSKSTIDPDLIKSIS